MMYYAKTNTADPRVGLITVGEYLTDAQAKALGEDLLASLVQRGVLGRVDEPERSVPYDSVKNGADGENNSENKGADSENNCADGENNCADGEDAEDAPELDIADVAVVEAAEAPATRGRRKSK